MYKLILVDDDVNTIQGIQRHIPLKELGIDIPPLEQYEITAVGDSIGDLAGTLNVVGFTEKGFFTDIKRKAGADPRQAA